MLHQAKQKKSVLLLLTAALIWGALLDCREQNITVYTFIQFATWTLNLKSTSIPLTAINLSRRRCPSTAAPDRKYLLHNRSSLVISAVKLRMTYAPLQSTNAEKAILYLRFCARPIFFSTIRFLQSVHCGETDAPCRWKSWLLTISVIEATFCFWSFSGGMQE